MLDEVPSVASNKCQPIFETKRTILNFPCYLKVLQNARAFFLKRPNLGSYRRLIWSKSTNNLAKSKNANLNI